MILVTGGTGFVGRALIARLIEQRRPVRTITRRPDRLPGELRADAVQVLAGDLHDAAMLGTALGGVHTVVHLAGAVQGSPAQLTATNHEAAAALAAAARRAGVRWFVHLSSAGVYGDVPHAEPSREEGPMFASTPYERSKLAGERAVVAALRGGAVGHVVLRPAGIYGGVRPATQQFLRQVAARRWWLSAPPPVIVHPTYIDDVVQAVLACLERPDLDGEAINIGGERALPLDEWALAVAHALGTPLHRLTLPRWAVAPPARAIAASARALGLPPPARCLHAALPLISRALDTSKARARIGFAPMPMAQALGATIAQARALGAL
jgi:nucleoside-diphosphate-sugar epimerase